MKQSKLAPLLAIIISFQLIISPLAMANATENQQGVNAAFNGILGVASSIYQQISANQPYIPSPQVAADMDAFRRQQTPLPDKFFNSQKLSQIPGLGEYLAMNGINPNSLNCVTLPTNMYESHNEVCRVGVTGDKGNPANQMQEAFAYMEQYSAIDKTYRNFSSESNVGGELFGVGCMKNAMEKLNGFFKYRTDELDKLVTNVEALQASFKEASKADLDAIEESTAVLNGGESELANKVKAKRPDLFDFGKRFGNPACNALMSKDKIDGLGSGGGLKAINQSIQDIVSKPSATGFSGESYAKANADVIADITSLADKIGKQTELNFGALSSNYLESFRGIAGSASSPNKLNGAVMGLMGDLQAKFAEKNGKLKATEAELGAELGGAEVKRLTDLARDPNAASAFETEVNNFEVRSKNACLRDSSQLDTVLSRIYDPSATKFANKNASNFMKDKLKQIIGNDKSSFARKLSELKALETQQGSRYYVKMENSYEVQDVDGEGKIKSTVVEASTTRTPSVFFSDVIKSCEAQFKANPLKSKYSGTQTVQKLRQISQDYKTLAKSHAQEIKDLIKNKLINCDSPSKANSTVTGACKPDSFDTSSPSFCAAGAFSCSKSMQECGKQAEKFVKDIKTERGTRITNYKAMVDKNKKDVIKLFDSALARYMKDGEMIRGAFGAGFSAPSGIKREVSGDKYLSAFNAGGENLMLEDPEKFTEMFKANIGQLKKSVEDQQRQIVGGELGSNTGLLAKHMEDTKAKYDKVAKDAAKFSRDCQSKHDAYVVEADNQRKAQAAEMAKKQAEMGEKQNEFCRKYSLAQSNPGPACSGNLDSLYGTIGGLNAQGFAASQEMARVCAGAQNGNSGNSAQQALTICNQNGLRVASTNAATPDSPAAAAERTKRRQALEEAEASLGIATQAKADLQEELTGLQEDSTPNASALAEVRRQIRRANETVTSKTIARDGAKKAVDNFNPTEWDTAHPAPAPTAATAATPPAAAASTAPAGLVAACAELERCQKGRDVTSSNNGGTTTTSLPNCNDDEKAVAARAVVQVSGGSPNADMELMPQFCNSMNGSMGPPKNFFDSMQQGFQRGFAGGSAIGQ